MALLNYLLLLVPLGTALADCNFFQNVTLGTYYDIISPNYPSNYDKNTNCEWHAETEAGYNIKLTCGNFSLPESANCSGDRVTVWSMEDIKLSDGHVFCGQRAPLVTTKSEKLIFVLNSTQDTEGGAFLCNITAIPAPEISGCKCGWEKQTRIERSVDRRRYEYPMMAGLIDQRYSSPYCGANIISPYYVLTTARCVQDLTNDLISVLVGTLGHGRENHPTSNLYQVEEIKIHPHYEPEYHNNDIALVRVQRPIVMSTVVYPVCLPFKYSSNDFIGEEVTLLGWGEPNPEGPSSSDLLETNVSVGAVETCKSVSRENSTDTVTSETVCTSSPETETCQETSGGPVLWYDESTRREYLIGVISYDRGCNGESQSVNTRVTSYLDWINSNTLEDELCMMV